MNTAVVVLVDALSRSLLDQGRDGRFFCRSFEPLPVSHVLFGVRDALRSPRA